MTWPSGFRFISFLYNTFMCINIPWRTHCIHTECGLPMKTQKENFRGGLCRASWIILAKIGEGFLRDS